MALQRTTEGRSSASLPSRESDIARQRAIFEAYPAAEQERIRADVRARLEAERRSAEFSARDDKDRRPGSALARVAWQVYGVKVEDL